MSPATAVTYILASLFGLCMLVILGVWLRFERRQRTMKARFQPGEFPTHEAEKCLIPHLHRSGWLYKGETYIWHEREDLGLPKGWYQADELVRWLQQNPA